jgi:hypothetical protein
MRQTQSWVIYGYQVIRQPRVEGGGPSYFFA